MKPSRVLGHAIRPIAAVCAAPVTSQISNIRLPHRLDETGKYICIHNYVVCSLLRVQYVRVRYQVSYYPRQHVKVIQTRTFLAGKRQLTPHIG